MRPTASIPGNAFDPPGLPHEELTRRVVRAVDVGVAVDARASEHAIALVDGDLVLVVEGRGMPRRNVAALTQHRHPDDQHPVVRRSMRVCLLYTSDAAD